MFYQEFFYDKKLTFYHDYFHEKNYMLLQTCFMAKNDMLPQIFFCEKIVYFVIKLNFMVKNICSWTYNLLPQDALI